MSEVVSTASTRPQLARGPRGHLVLGHVRQLQHDALNFYLGLARDYGAVARVRLLSRVGYVVSDPDGIRQILQRNHVNYDRNLTAFRPLRAFLGNGLAISDGALWRQQRRLMQPAFHRERVQDLGRLVVTSAAGLLDGWHRRADSDDVVDVQQESLTVALHVASSALFGLDADDGVQRLGRAFEAMVQALSEYVFLPFPPLGVPTPRNRRIRRTVRTLDMLVSDLVHTRRRHPRSGDLLALLLTARDDNGQGMDDTQLRDEIVTLLFAGHETSANTLTWACYELSRHPQIQERLWNEVHAVLRGQPPTVAHLTQLPYTRMVVDEVLRLYPPAPFVPRRIVQDSTINGYLLPANHVVSANICASHRDPRYWHRPELFNPERFSSEHPDPGVRHAYFPFGAGPHLCIGNGLALMEIPLVLAMLVQRYRLRPTSGEPVTPTLKLTLRPPDGLPLRIERRGTAPTYP